MTAVEFAIQMELDGEKYYLEQGERTEHPELKAVFALLAREERAHADLLKKYVAKTAYTLEQSQIPSHILGVFANEQDLQVEYKARPDQVDAYKLALEKEKESIALYEKMGSETDSDEEQRLFAFLVEQEKIHYDTFQDLIEHILKAKQWVEAAEFGIREDY